MNNDTSTQGTQVSDDSPSPVIPTYQLFPFQNTLPLNEPDGFLEAIPDPAPYQASLYKMFPFNYQDLFQNPQSKNEMENLKNSPSQSSSMLANWDIEMDQRGLEALEFYCKLMAKGKSQQLNKSKKKLKLEL